MRASRYLLASRDFEGRLVVGWNDFTPLRGDHKGKSPARRIGREVPNGAIAHGKIATTRVEAIEATTLEIAAIDKARPVRNVAADDVAIARRAIGPVLAIERVAPASPRINSLGNGDALGVVDIRPASQLAH